MTLGDKFLAVLSSSRQFPLKGENSISNIVDATIRTNQQGSANRWDYRKWINDMEELGFLYVDIIKRKIFVEPQSLDRSVNSPNALLLNGARTPDFIARLRSQAKDHKLTIHENAYDPYYPAKIKVAGGENDLAGFANDLGISFASAPRTYDEALRVFSCSDIVKKWQFNDTTLEQGEEVHYFNPGNLQFDGSGPGSNFHYNLGRRETKYGRRYNMYRFHNNSLQVKADVDPRWAKWFCLARSKFALTYDEGEKLVLAPKFCRLPLPLARTLAMCGQKAPQEVSCHFGDSKIREFIEYREVPKIIAKLVFEKLGIPMNRPARVLRQTRHPSSNLEKKDAKKAEGKSPKAKLRESPIARLKLKRMK